MTEQKFRSEMRRIKTMMEMNSDPGQSDYYAGYQRGLRRAFHGEDFGTAEEHALWMSLVDRDDEQSKRRGHGYRDGLAFGEISSRVGAPNKIGDDPVLLDPLRVSGEMKAALEERAQMDGLKLPDARRAAYRRYIQKEA